MENSFKIRIHNIHTNSLLKYLDVLLINILPLLPPLFLLSLMDRILSIASLALFTSYSLLFCILFISSNWIFLLYYLYGRRRRKIISYIIFFSLIFCFLHYYFAFSILLPWNIWCRFLLALEYKILPIRNLLPFMLC